MSSGDPTPVSGGGKPSGAGTPKNESQADKRHQGSNKGRAFTRPTTRQPKFEGKSEALKGHIYDCSASKQAEAYIRTTKEIAEYVGRTYSQGADIRCAMEELEMPTFGDNITDPPEGATKTEVRTWEKEVDELVKQKSKLKRT
jgi:hypothetical protein